MFLVELGGQFACTPQQHFLCVVEGELYADQKVAMVVAEVGHRVLAGCLVRTDELVVNVVGGDSLEIALPILGLPCNMIDPLVPGLSRRQNLQHVQAVEETLPFCWLQGSVVLADSRLRHQ